MGWNLSRIVLTSQGTYGDFRPFLLLGKQLARRGHHVRMAVNPAMVDEAARAGLDAVPCGTALDPQAARRIASRFDEQKSAAVDPAETWRLLDIEGSYRTLVAACADADLLISASLQQAAPMAQETLGIPWAVVSLLPEQFPLRDEAAAVASPAESSPDVAAASLAMGRDIARRLLELRDRLGLRRLTLPQLAPLAWSAPLVMLAASRHFCSLASPAAERVTVTGFFFDEDQAVAWQPPPDWPVQEGRDDEPIVLAFGSLPLESPAAVLEPIVAATHALGRRLIVQRGWADFGPRHLPAGLAADHVTWIDAAPHDWLFRRASLVIHHGGVGTTAAALRAGRPALVIPFGNDQPFNARQIVRLQVGESLTREQLDRGAVQEALVRLSSDSVRRRAEEMRERLMSESGLDEACLRIEQLLSHPRLGRHSPIPRIIHQMGPDPPVPASLLVSARRWQALHPHWEYRYWSDREVRRFLVEQHPALAATYDRCATLAERETLVRSRILARFGGLFANQGCEPARPLDGVLAGCELSLDGLPATLPVTGDAASVASAARTARCVASRPGHEVWRHDALCTAGSAKTDQPRSTGHSAAATATTTANPNNEAPPAD